MKEIVKAIEKIAIKIAEEVKFADFGYSDQTNETGDKQLKLDIRCDKIVEEEFLKVPTIKALISEEKKEELIINKEAKYIVAYDPLDGSSLVDVNFAIGTIFGIYEDEVTPSNLKGAVYALYGPRVELVVCIDRPVLYRLGKDMKFKEAFEITLKEKGKLNASGATQKGWSNKHRALIRSLFDEGYRLRYSGAMVADLHQILLKGGGLFSYPATTDAPNAKLRVVFEVLPFAYIFERAGGATTDGESKTLFDIKISKIHQTSPCFFGSRYEIEKTREFYRE
ncbi:class 1 fructose-bisphosphatase [uncultured Campylobacter sp.]|uniref:class 1 fructose-bisphosphatase n=1 Tax=uncultured Campylobacter sp. TaxID=218934 RepID=UPI00262B7BBB|nr:class 1 fructose-bisphosphatase [uncultured Campylobacter sp.]